MTKLARDVAFQMVASETTDSLKSATDNRVKAIWQFVSSLYAAMIICSACTMVAVALSNFGAVDWADRNSMLVVLWSLATALGLGVALTGYVLQSNKIAIGVAAICFLGLVFPNCQSELVIAVFSSLMVGLLAAILLNRITRDTGACFRGFAMRVGILSWAILVIAIMIPVFQSQFNILLLPIVILKVAIFCSGVFRRLYDQYRNGILPRDLQLASAIGA